MLIATAGHIDHGKTSLIQALTGVDTDRLPEERARGISIDLGFAYWRPAEDEMIGFIDVPGHERFVRNMLAGVSVIDLALMVVAADDGVMPQTAEHAQILDLLGVKRAIVAITKCDRVSRDRIQAVLGEIETLLEPTGLAGAPIYEVSAVVGAGVPELGEALRAAARDVAPRSREGRNFRLTIDRAFSVTGVGLVATGVVVDGELDAGARVILSPRGLETRVRGLQSGGHAVDRVGPGERCAVNLAGVELAQVHRGDWLLAPEQHAPTSRLEALLEVSAPLKHHAPVHLHLGAADIAGRVLIAGQASIPEGGRALVQLALERPTSAVQGDAFVLRDPSARRTIGGGRVIDPFADSVRRGRAERELFSAALQAGSAAQVLAALLAIPGHEVDTRRFERTFNLTADAARALYRDLDAVLIGPLALPAGRVAAIKAEIVDRLGAFHREHPDEGGMTPRDLKAQLSEPVSATAFAALQKQLGEERAIETAGALVKQAGHSASLSPGDSMLWRRLVCALEERDVLAFTAAEMAGDLRTSEPVVKALLYRMRANGEVWRITDKRFVLRERVAGLAATAAEVAQAVGGRGFTAAQYRDAIGAGRTLAIQILEFFDAIGVTGRNGDLRRIRPDYELLVGRAAPYGPATRLAEGARAE